MTGRRDKQLELIVLSLCPAVVASTRVLDALFMAAGVFLVLAGMSLLLPLLRARGTGEPAGTLPSRVVWGGFLLSACLTAVYELALGAVAPAVSARLGIYVPLIAMSFLAVGRLDALSAVATVRAAALDAAWVGAIFSVTLVIVSVVREVLGSGTITLGATIPVAPFFADPARAAGFAGGALICLGYAAGAVRLLTRRAAPDDAAEGEGEAG